MVTDLTYKSYSRQIAKLFCFDDANKTLCEGSIATRLNTFLDDYTYPYFLSKLPQGRVYITNLEAFQDYGFRIVVTDLITGIRETAWWTIEYKLPYLSKLPGKLLKHQYNIISENKTFTDANKNDLRITWNPVKPGYGITFVPGSVGGGGTPGGGTPGGGTIQIIPDQKQPVTVPESSFNLQNLLSNPIVLIGGGIVLFLLLKNKF